MLKNSFWQRLEQIYTKNDLEIIKSWFNTKKRKVSFRINLLNSNKEEIEKNLLENWLIFSKIDFLENAYILENWMEKDLWNLDIFKDWKNYLQSIASQIPVYFLDLKTWDKVLDLTAAPWSKTSQIASLLWNSWEIIACDNNQIRIDKLNFTLKRQWVKNTKVIKTDARNLWNLYKNETFDKILADLPCSAEWRFNSHIEKSYAFWNENIIQKNAILQKEILSNSIKLLKKNWILVYSTCTIAPEENEEIIDYLLKNFSELEIENINLDYKYTRPWITNFNWKKYNKKLDKSLRCLVNEETEWFFVAKLRKS